MQRDRNLNPLLRSHWTVLAVGLAVSGTLGSVLAARAVANNRATEARHSFETSAADVTSRLRLTLEREGDLAISEAAQLAANPTQMTSAFEAWAVSADVLSRFPEVQGLGVIVPVPAASVPALAARLGVPITVTPPGPRAFYCLSIAGLGRPGFPDVPLGTDFCTGDAGASLLGARDSGLGSYEPIELGDRDWLGVQTPFYAGGVTPRTVEERRARLVGWAGMAVDPQIILAQAVDSAPLAVSLRHEGVGGDVTFQLGRAQRDGMASATALGNGWTVRTVGAPAPSGLLSGLPVAFLVGGTAITALLAALLLLLGTGRTRALRLVQTRTGELRHQALHDALTGLPNRALVLDRVQQALSRANRDNTPLAVMFLDLDGFKAVNDIYGHDAGDRLLQAVSSRLSQSLRDTDTVGRLGGDEFVVLAEGQSLSMGPEVIAERIQAVLSEPFHLDGHDQIVVRTHASIGIAVGLRPSAGDLLRDADVALYEAKAAGKDCFVLFAPEMQTAVQDRLELETDLRNALGTDQLFLAYQPTLDLRSESITGVEALLRWNHPTRGLVMPDSFITIAEETGLIVPIGRDVLMQACRQAAAWQRAGHPLSVAVNVSGRQLDHQNDLVGDVQAALSSSGLEPSQLTLEITETMLMRDARRSSEQLKLLKSLGVRIAIDDFGTGYCSLSYLQQFPVDALKIDRSFITRIAESPEAGALIHTLVQLGKTLGIETYAEGIEERSQLHHLQREECDSGQGYLFARPLTPEAVEAMLSSPSTLDPNAIPRQGRSRANAP